jgi:thiamine kinase-like enzyme
LVKTFRSNDWGVTASYKISDHKAMNGEVICKIGFLPIFHTSVNIYSLLNSMNSELVPHLIHGEFKENKIWMLFKPFEGDTISKNDNKGSLQDIASTMAKIQIQSYNLVDKYSNSIPVISIESIPDLLDKLVDRYFHVWKDKNEYIAGELGIPYDTYNIIMSIEGIDFLRKQTAAFSKELESMHIPYSIDHLDLHSGNAARQNNGAVIIYDWEESVLSCPFFSLDKLLDETGEFEYNEETTENTLWTKSQIAIRDLYLINFSNINPEKITRAFDIAMCIAPIKYAYQSTFFLDQVGWHENAPALIAQSIIKAYQRCKAIL